MYQYPLCEKAVPQVSDDKVIAKNFQFETSNVAKKQNRKVSCV